MDSIGHPETKSNTRPTPEQAALLGADGAMRDEIKHAQMRMAAYAESLHLIKGGAVDFAQIDDLVQAGQLIERAARNLRKAAMAASQAAAQRRHEALGAVAVFPLALAPQKAG